MRISDWSSDVCSSDLIQFLLHRADFILQIQSASVSTMSSCGAQKQYRIVRVKGAITIIRLCGPVTRCPCPRPCRAGCHKGVGMGLGRIRCGVALLVVFAGVPALAAETKYHLPHF